MDRLGLSGARAAMTDKSFYQAAASEVSQGQIDQALWLKVNAEFPGATAIVRQAKYIQLRAQELAREARSSSISSITPRSGKQWMLYGVGTFLAAALLGALTESGGVFWLAIVIAVIVGVVLRKKFGNQPGPTVAVQPAPQTPPEARLAPPIADPAQHQAKSNPTEEIAPEHNAKSLPAGDFGLAKTYWLFQVLPALIVSIANEMVPPNTAVVLLLLFCLYEMFALPGVWNAATRYPGPSVWAVFAKIGVVGAACSIASFVVIFTKETPGPRAPVVQQTTVAPTAQAPAAATAAAINLAYNNEVEKLVQKYPVLDPKFPTYSAALNTSILARKQYYETHGMAPTDALDRAVDEIMSARQRAAHRAARLTSTPYQPAARSSQACNFGGVMGDDELRACGVQPATNGGASTP